MLNCGQFVRANPSTIVYTIRVDLLLGDAPKAKEQLGWTATTDLEELARIMTQHDYDLAQREAHAKNFVPS